MEVATEEAAEPAAANGKPVNGTANGTARRNDAAPPKSRTRR
jgi:hypothetical protein